MDVRAFRGIRYDAAKAGDVSLLVSPPYDVIDAKLQRELYERSPYGIVRIDFGIEEPGDDAQKNKYTRAAAAFEAWKKDGVLRADAEPCLYYVEEDYKGEFGASMTRSGFLGSVRVETAESGVYRPHEKTLAGPKADRLELTRACRANLSPVFSLYDDSKGKVDSLFAAWKASAGKPDVEIPGARLWAVGDKALADAVARELKDKSFFIADGHHRYETSLNYLGEMRRTHPDATGDEPWNFVLMYLVNLWSPGLSVLPTHRAVFGFYGFDGDGLVSRLRDRFEVEEISGGVDALLARMKERRGTRQTLGVGLAGGKRFFTLSPKADLDLDALLPDRAPALRKLDVTILHSLVIEKILGIDEKAQEEQRNLRYVKEADDLALQLAAGDADVGFFLNPTPVSQVKEAAEAGQRMPQKSTFFYPKLVTGLVIHPLT